MSGTAVAPALGTEQLDRAGGKVAIYMFSGTWDRFLPMACLSQAAAAMGMEVHVFVAGFAILAFRKEPYDLPFPQDYAHLEKRITEAAAVNLQPWDAMVRKARELGAKFHACSLMCQMLELKQDDLRSDLIDDIVGFPTFLQLAEHGETYLI